MSQLQAEISGRLSRMRKSFDDTFASPPAAPADDLEDFLAICVADARYAIRMADISALSVNTKVVPVPTTDPSLLGIAGIRGQLVPVYALGYLLGHGVTRRERFWLGLVGGAEPIALALNELDGHLRAKRSDVFALERSATPHDHLRQALRVDKGVRYIVDISSIIGSVRHRAAEPAAATGS